MSAIKQLEENMQRLENSKAPILKFIEQAGRNEPRLAELLAARIETLAVAMIESKRTPDTSKIEGEIAEMQSAVAKDMEMGQIASAAIAIIESRKSAVAAELRQAEINARDEAVAQIYDEFPKLLEDAKLNTLDLVALLDSSDLQRGRIRSVTDELELKLRKAGAIAWVHRQQCNTDSVWLGFCDELRKIRVSLQPRFSALHMDVPRWCWGGVRFDVDGFTGEVCSRLRQAGEIIRT